MRLKPLSRQVVAITARLAAKGGARVMLIAREADALAIVVRDIVANGGIADFTVADVGDREQLRSAAARTAAIFGPIDTWVSNAGVAIYANLLDTPLAEHERMFRTNYFGCVNSAQVAMEYFSGEGAAFIAIGSIAGDMPSPVMGAYAASKHALAAFVRSLRIESRARGARVSITLIKPSGMATPINRHAANHREGLPKIPPPAYDPLLVAQAILEAAVSPRREVTIGGVGALEVLFANHFPALFERIAPVVGPLLNDRGKAPSPSNNLFDARPGGERSPDEAERRVSLLRFARRHGPVVVALSAAVLGGLWRRKGRVRY
jgi:short-subunit dehydrogenase